MGIERSGFTSKLVASPILLQFSSNSSPIGNWSRIGIAMELLCNCISGAYCLLRESCGKRDNIVVGCRKYMGNDYEKHKKEGKE